MIERLQDYWARRQEAQRQKDHYIGMELLSAGRTLCALEKHRLGWTVKEVVDAMNEGRREREEIDDVTDQDMGILVSKFTEEGLLYRSSGGVRTEFILSSLGYEMIENHEQQESGT